MLSTPGVRGYYFDQFSERPEGYGRKSLRGEETFGPNLILEGIHDRGSGWEMERAGVTSGIKNVSTSRCNNFRTYSSSSHKGPLAPRPLPLNVRAHGKHNINT